MNAGVEHASGDALLFLHADARLANGSGAAMLEALAEPSTVGGNFRVRFGDTLHGCFLASFYHVIRRLTVCYGDSAIFCRRDAFERVGGFPPYPIMEDITFVRRLRRLGRFAYPRWPGTRFATPLGARRHRAGVGVVDGDPVAVRAARPAHAPGRAVPPHPLTGRPVTCLTP